MNRNSRFLWKTCGIIGRWCEWIETFSLTSRPRFLIWFRSRPPVMGEWDSLWSRDVHQLPGYRKSEGLSFQWHLHRFHHLHAWSCWCFQTLCILSACQMCVAVAGKASPELSPLLERPQTLLRWPGTHNVSFSQCSVGVAPPCRLCCTEIFNDYTLIPWLYSHSRSHKQVHLPKLNFLYFLMQQLERFKTDWLPTVPTRQFIKCTR